ncbi:MAG: hypothetical protein Q9227_000012 [Pyrenula ochraceoflavens]
MEVVCEPRLASRSKYEAEILELIIPIPDLVQVGPLRFGNGHESKNMPKDDEECRYSIMATTEEMSYSRQRAKEVLSVVTERILHYCVAIVAVSPQIMMVPIDDESGEPSKTIKPSGPP